MGILSNLIRPVGPAKPTAPVATPTKVAPATPTQTAAAGTPPTTALSRFNTAASGEQISGVNGLALIAAENTAAAGATGTPGTAASQQAGASSVQRLAGSQWAGMTGQVNNAQRAGDGAVWVTVPVDKVQVTPAGSRGIAPVYATAQGYRSKPGESVGSIPPPSTQAVGKP